MAELREEDIQLIIKHLTGTLTDAEALLFEDRCQNDTTFYAEFQAYEDVKLAGLIGGRTHVKSILKNEAIKYHAESYEKKGAGLKTIFLKSWILKGLAASFLLCLCWWTIQYLQTPTFDTTRFFADKFEPFSETPITHYRDGEAIKIDPLFQQRHDTTTIKIAIIAIDLYTQKNYAASIDAFNKIQVQDDTLLLCKANSLLLNDNLQEALSILSQLAANGKGFTKDFAQWYLAWAYIKTNQIEKSHTLLENIAQQSTHLYKVNAKELLKDSIFKF